MLCLHHNDPDGRCAAAIVRRRFGAGVRCIEMDYGRPFPAEALGTGEDLAVVDFSLPPPLWAQLRGTAGRRIWIDHHASAIADMADQPPLEGLRALDRSACELAWTWCFPAQPVPRAVELIADRDLWTWRFGEETGAFHEGLRLDPHPPDAPIWDDLLGGGGARLTEVMARGKVCLAYRRQLCAEFARDQAFEVDFEGRRCLCANLKLFGSDAFGDRLGDYDMGITFGRSRQRWSVTLYSRTRDVLDVARKYGGGGHPRAAGFTCDTLPFL